MKLVVRVGERLEEVAIERDRAGFVVRVGSSSYRVDRVAVGPSRHSLLVDGEQFEVTAFRDRGDDYWVATRRGLATATVVDPLTHLANQAATRSGRRRAAAVTAMMPGRVVAVLVEEGDEVTAGQGLVVLEAMKMENEIEAEADGVVRKVHVEPGQAVEGGDPLVEIG